MKIKDIMTKDIASLNSSDTVERAAQLMKEHDVGAIPVCEQEKVIGVITDRDIALRTVADGENATQQTVRNAMTSTPVFAEPDMDVREAARIMKERQIRRLPVIENGNLVGMVSLGDFAVEEKLDHCAGEALCGISEPCSPKM
ncbi:MULTISPECIES: CBS domain-containing protein [Clostridium]|uniref:CBS domain-containing protein n=1 Tax=Clostridium TaxID=1485 RepID=UPI00069FE79C|nr:MULTISPECIES: CBS domain-containing protein [Clostridium]KOF56923.1 CBS domain-containing protein YhcV [Clostridium sp. DMHC 10]MCD2346572.1 CBS domain-containing protein [Clostridium guangxiense]